MKTKLFEETKKELIQSKQVNNNCNKSSVTAVFTQTDNIKSDVTVADRKTEGKQQARVTEAVYRTTASVKKIQTNTKPVSALKFSSNSESTIASAVNSIHSPVLTKVSII